TRVPGIQLTELQPLSARMMDKFAIVRSITHRQEDGNVGHSDADQICFTGYRAGPNPDVNVMPSCGSYAVKQLQHLNPALPAYVMIPRMVPGTGSAWLGQPCNPFETQADPAQPVPFKVPNFRLAEGVSPNLLGQRRKLLRAFDSARPGEQGEALEKFQAQALDILTSGAAQKAFDLDS